MADIVVTNTLAQRDGRDIFTIDITRTSGNRSLSFTEPELEAVIVRQEVLRQEKLAALRGANLDGTDPTVLKDEVDTLRMDIDDAKSALQLMAD